MEAKNISGFGVREREEEETAMDLPPGFRFHPTDEELITQYLSPKVTNSTFSAIAISEVDLNKCEPWDLPKRARMGEKECYFFCKRDRKYPTGLRTNRATEAGYWKATGKDKEIYKGKSLVGMKKTLVFYKGRAPKGSKSNWVMHEYRLDGQLSLQNLPSSAKNDWVICRVFQKTLGGKKIPLFGLIRPDPFDMKFAPIGLPPLTESSPYSTDDGGGDGNGDGGQTKLRASHVSCFSNPVAQTSSSYHNDPSFGSYINYSAYSDLNGHMLGNYVSGQHQLLNSVLDNHKVSPNTTGLTSNMNVAEISSVENYMGDCQPFDDNLVGPSSYGGPIDLDVLWNY